MSSMTSSSRDVRDVVKVPNKPRIRTDIVYKRKSAGANSASKGSSSNKKQDLRVSYKALKTKHRLLEQESFILAEELEGIDAEIRDLEKEKSALLDRLLVLEGLDKNPYLPWESQH